MIRTLIADDEAPARAKIAKLLATEEDFEVVGEATDGAEAVAAIRRLAPDVVFLDIRMPRSDGFRVIDEIGVQDMPVVVFVTAYDEHALKAFEVHALDYLLKPFAASRFQGVLRRVRRRLAGGSPADLARRLGEALEALSARPHFLTRLLVQRQKGREVLLPLERVKVIRSRGNYLRLCTAGAEFSRRGTLSALADRLDPEHFLRINRSEIVRLDAVREFQPWFHGDYRVVLDDGTTLTWSRRYRARSRGKL